MKILWITNILLPEAQYLLSGKGNLKGTGGWMIGAAEALLRHDDIILYVATASRQVTELRRLEGGQMVYYVLPAGKKGITQVNHSLEPFWRIIHDEVHPDVVHLHGTEFTHGLAYLEACGADNVCASIQGLVSAYYYYYYGLTQWEIIRSTTLRSFFAGGILSGYRDFKRRARSEKEILRRINHIIGRTSWDRDRTWAINPNAIYHYGGETLRSDFYEGEVWQYDKCHPHTIFVSQAGYPIKGLHMVLRAMPLILRHYPDAKVRVAGSDITFSQAGVKSFYLLGDYGNIIRKYIRKYNLQDCVTFTGPLNGAEMRDEFLRSNVFVCPSTIENSPNSLGEAQLLGVPIIASYVGGIPDMMKGFEDYLYRFEEIEMLAHKVCRIFELEDKIETNGMRQMALQRHNPQKNATDLLNIYSLISDIPLNY